MRRTLTMLFVLLLAFAPVVGCANDGDTATSTASSSDQKKKPTGQDEDEDEGDDQDGGGEATDPGENGDDETTTTDDDSSTTTTDDETSTTGDEATTSTAGDLPEGGDPEAYCALYKEYDEKYADSDGSFDDELLDDIRSLIPLAPPELRDDIELLASYFEEFASLTDEQMSDPAFLETLLNESELAAVDAASAAMEDYTEATCGISEDD